MFHPISAGGDAIFDRPAALPVDCRIRGQDLRLVVTHTVTASLGVGHACGYTFHGFRQN
jgi:hypothetical protein